MNKFYGRGVLMVLASVITVSPLPGRADNVTPLASRCDLSVSSPVIDYGVMTRWQLQYMADGSVSPGIRSLTLSVVCPWSRTMTLMIEGNTNEQGALRYGEHGFIRLRLQDAQLDGNAVELQELTPTGALKEHSDQTTTLEARQKLAPVVQGQVIAGRILTARLEIQPILTTDGARISSQQSHESVLKLTLVD